MHCTSITSISRLSTKTTMEEQNVTNLHSDSYASDVLQTSLLIF